MITVYRNYIILIAFSLFFFSACKSSIKHDRLYGKWHYTKVSQPNSSPPDSVTNTELQEMKPYIEFTRENKLRIMWGGKLLSQGSFITDGDNIRFNEEFSDGQSREFPFYVSKLTDKEIIFETVGEEGSRVTAVKE